MAYKNANYRPQARNRAILARAWEHVQGVPYTVTARWLFYRLFQEGHYHDKDDYNDKFLPLLSRARHNVWQGWQPDTLADDRRTAIERGDGHLTPGDWLDAIIKQGRCNLARWKGQKHYVEIWFEAGAMIAQFEYHTRDLTLRPFFGMPSIPYKWDIAKALERAAGFYKLPVVVLYFGDMDKAGNKIPETSVADIREWCDVDFDFVRVGLNPGDEIRYSLPENFEKPGAYQWEALGDAEAGTMITEAVGRYVDYVGMTEIEELEGAVTVRFRDHVAKLRQQLE